MCLCTFCFLYVTYLFVPLISSFWLYFSLSKYFLIKYFHFFHDFLNIFKFYFLSDFPRHHNLQNLLQIYAHSMLLKYRNLPQNSLLLPLCYTLYTHYICMLQTQQCIVITIIPYNLLYFKETKRRGASRDQ